MTRRASTLLAITLALAGSSALAPVLADRAEAQANSGLRRSLGSSSSPMMARTTGTTPQDELEAVYGNPSGSGAGVTGYQSKKTRKAGKPVKRKVAEPAPQVQPRRGVPEVAASPSSPETTGSVSRRRRAPDEDPFAPIGLHTGAFVLYPSIELMGGTNSNPGQAPGGQRASLLTTTPELRFQSDWSRHELKGELRSTHTAYLSGPYDNTFTLGALIDGRLDIHRDWRGEMQLRAAIAPESLSSPNLSSGVASAPIVASTGVTAGLVRMFGRAEVALRGLIDRVDYGEAKYRSGLIDDNEDRNYVQPGLALRGSYEVSPGVKPFVEVSTDRRYYDQTRDDFGYERSSTGLTGRVGSTFEMTNQLKGEASIGVTRRSYDDNRLKDLSGLVADSSLIWTASALTTVKLGARSMVEESTSIGVSGLLRRDVDLTVEHAFRRDLVATAKVGYGTDIYQGSTREDERISTTLGLTYKLTRTVQIKGEWRHDKLTSNTAGVDYTADTFLAGMRFQR